jgi:branched-subunit amino acid transport protein
MTEPNTFWLYVLICALVSAVCRLLPLAVEIERLPSGVRAFIDRLGKYTSVAMLISLLAGSLYHAAQALLRLSHRAGRVRSASNALVVD